MNVEDKVQYWVEIADYDMKTAKVMLAGKRYLYVGFMCHQVVEKILKAYYVFKTEQIPPFIHNLTILAKKSDIYVKMSESQQDLILYLEPLNIEARYPAYKDKLFKTFTEDKCKNILKNTEDLFEWIKQNLI
jgi:HEPN domain-containing protein